MSKPQPYKSLRELLAAKSRQLADGCHQWTGSHTYDFGQLTWRGKHYNAHRAAWEVARGPIPEGHYIYHTCALKSCINPDHLTISLEKFMGGRRGPANPHCKFTLEQCQAVARDPRTRAEITADGVMSYFTVNAIKSGKHWSCAHED